jgi:hypothetical protein
MIEIKPLCRFKLRALAPGAKEFYASSKFLGKFDIERFVTFWKNQIENGQGVIFAALDDGEIIGAIGGMAYPEPYIDEISVQEFFWFVRPGNRGLAGLRLYDAFEGWAIEKGASHIRMVHLMDSMPEKLERVYGRLGFVPVEKLYSKDLAA